MKLVAHERNGEEARDDYQTPDAVFQPLNRIYRFEVDLAADEKNAKCENYFYDAFNSDWSQFRSGWCNPPFSMWAEFIERCALEAAGGMTIGFLVPPRCGTEAWHEYASLADTIIFLQGRVSFLLDGVPKRNNGADSVVLVFEPNLPNALYGTPRTVFWNWKA